MMGFPRGERRSLQYKGNTEGVRVPDNPHQVPDELSLFLSSGSPILATEREKYTGKVMRSTECNTPAVSQEHIFTVLPSSPKIIWPKSY